MSVMRRGGSLSWGSRRRRPRLTTSPCELSFNLPYLARPRRGESDDERAKLICSHNTTVKGSKGVVSTFDQTYASIPSDSRKPPAAIDPSSKSL